MKRQNYDKITDCHYLDYIFERIEEDTSLSELDFDTEQPSLIDVKRALSTLRRSKI